MTKILKILAFVLVLFLASCVDNDVDEFTIYCKDYDGTVIESITYLVGETIEVYAEPTREGYTFLSWDNEVPNVMPAENLTFQATYVINQFTISK